MVFWDALGTIGQLSLFLLTFMAASLFLSMFVARARKRRRKGESYLAFFIRDITRHIPEKEGEESGVWFAALNSTTNDE